MNPSDLHELFDVAYIIVSALGLVVGLMIKNAILKVGGRIDVHIAEDKIIHADIERRLTRIE